MELHEFLNDWLARSGWGVTRLADEIGVRQGMVSKWVNADPRRRGFPSRENMRRLAPVLGVSVLELMRMAGYFEGEELPESAPSIDPDLAVVNAAWPHLDVGLKRAINLIVNGASQLTSRYLRLQTAAAA